MKQPQANNHDSKRLDVLAFYGKPADNGMDIAHIKSTGPMKGRLKNQGSENRCACFCKER
jgi:hypothetical protein